ncbi:hypothetical protein T492DRAFT_988335, partial [Pavlovales sp. CCMP2436]
MVSIAFVICLGAVTPTPAPASALRMAGTRRVFTSALLSSAVLGLAAPDAHAYRTAQQFMEDTQRVSQASALYARFAVVKERMSQLSDFNTLADKEQWDNLQAFARNYNQVVQNDELLKIIDMLDAPQKDEAKKYAELVRNDLKAIDKAARLKDPATVKEVALKLEGNLNAFLSLRPAELAD